MFDRSELNLDHVVPRDRGGPTSWENIVCSCIACNTRKSNRTPFEAGMNLVRKPKRPKWRPFVQVNFTLHRHDSWRHFVDLAYWNVELILGCRGAGLLRPAAGLIANPGVGMFESHRNFHAVPGDKDAALHVRHECLTLRQAHPHSPTAELAKSPN